MRRSPRSLLAWSAALLVAVITIVVVFSDLATLHRRARDFGAPRPVLVAAHDLPLGATLGASDVRAISRYAAATPANAVVDVDDAIGRVVAVPVLAGSVLLEPHLTERDRDGLSGLVPFGYRAVRIRPDDGLRPPVGAVVDALVALDPTLSERREGQIVARVRPACSRSRPTTMRSQTERALPSSSPRTRRARLAFAAANGVLTLALAPPEDACCR